MRQFFGKTFRYAIKPVLLLLQLFGRLFGRKKRESDILDHPNPERKKAGFRAFIRSRAFRITLQVIITLSIGAVAANALLNLASIYAENYATAFVFLYVPFVVIWPLARRTNWFYYAWIIPVGGLGSYLIYNLSPFMQMPLAIAFAFFFTLIYVLRPLGQGKRWFFYTWTITLGVCLSLILSLQIIAKPTAAISIVLGLFFLFVALVRPFEAFVIWVVASPISQTAGLDFGGSLPAMTFDRIALGIILLSVIARKLSTKDVKKEFGIVDLSILSFIIICSLNVVLTRVAPNPVKIYGATGVARATSDAFQMYIDHYIFAFITFYIVKNLIKTRKQIEILVIAVIAIALYLVPIGVFEHFTGRTWFTQTSELMGNDANRAAGPFKSPAVYGAVLGICLLGAIHFYFQSKKPILRFFFLATIFAIGLGEIMTYTRSAWLSPILAFLMMTLLYKGKRKQLAVWLLIGVLALVSSQTMIQNSKYYKTRVANESPLRARMYITAQMLEMIKEKPIFGYGIGNLSYYKNFHPVFVPGVKRAEQGSSSHNTFLTILVETGVVGFVTYMTILLAIGWQWFVTYIRSRDDDAGGGKQLLAVIGCSIICYLATAMVIDVRYAKYSEYLFWMLLAIVTVQYSIIFGNKKRGPSALIAATTVDQEQLLNARN